MPCKLGNGWFLLLVLLLGGASGVQAATPPRWGISVGPGLSFSSYHFVITTTYRHFDNEFYLGPRLLSDSYLPGRQPYGGLAGWRYRLGGQRLVSFLGVEYQLTVFKPVGRNLVQELFWNYGVEYPLTETLAIGNSLGYGLSLESYQRQAGVAAKRFVSPDGLVRLYVQYSFP